MHQSICYNLTDDYKFECLVHNFVKYLKEGVIYYLT